jgi:hypothetical protein
MRRTGREEEDKRCKAGDGKKRNISVEECRWGRGRKFSSRKVVEKKVGEDSREGQRAALSRRLLVE